MIRLPLIGSGKTCAGSLESIPGQRWRARRAGLSSKRPGTGDHIFGSVRYTNFGELIPANHTNHVRVRLHCHVISVRSVSPLLRSTTVLPPMARASNPTAAGAIHTPWFGMDCLKTCPAALAGIRYRYPG